MGVHGFDQCLDHRGVGKLGNSVTKVEDVAIPMAIGTTRRTERVEHAHRLGACCGGSGQQHHGVEVALNRAPVAHPRPRPGDIHRPVDADGIAARGGQRLEPSATPLGKKDARHGFAIVVAVEALYNLRHGRQGKLAVGGIGEHATPRCRRS